MRSVNSIITKRLLLPALAALLATACVKEQRADCPPEKPERLFTLSVQVTVPAANPTRVAGDETEPGSGVEGFIDVATNDFHILIYDDATNRLYTEFVPEHVTVSEGGNRAQIFNFVGHIERKSEGGGNMLPGADGAEIERIRVMVLANWYGFNGTSYAGFAYPNYTIGSAGTLFSDRTAFNFRMPLASDGASSWIPSSGRPASGIPMVGLSEAIRIDDARQTDQGFILESQAIPMLRSLAKIEIVNTTKESDQVVLTGATLNQYNTTGRFVPDATQTPNAGWNKEAQVALPTLPDGITQGAGTNLAFQPVTQQVTDVEQQKRSRTSLVAYLPEMDLTKFETEARPELSVDLTVNGAPLTGNQILLAQYDSKGQPDKSNYLDYLLRNHIYRFNIVSVGVLGDLQIVIETPEWSRDDEQWEYKDAQAVFATRKAFTWTNLNPVDPGQPDAPLIPPYFEPVTAPETPDRTVVVTMAAAAEATFTFEQPERGTWTLSLYGDDDTDNDAFRIDVWDAATGTWTIGLVEAPDGTNTVVDSVTGDVGTEAKIRIVPVAPLIGDTPNQARVVMSVTTFDGRMIPVKLPGNDATNNDPSTNGPVPRPESASDFYTIKQNQSGF